MLTRVFAAEYWQSLTNRSPNHERVGGTQAVLIRLSEGEVVEVKTQLADTARFFDGYLASVSSIFPLGILRIYKRCLILICGSSASELFG